MLPIFLDMALSPSGNSLSTFQPYIFIYEILCISVQAPFPPHIPQTEPNPLGSCFLGTAYGCTSGGTGRLNPTLNSSPPIYTNTTSIYTASGALQKTNPLSLSAPSSALVTSSKSEVPHRPSCRKSPTHRLPPHGPLHAPGAPPAFSSSSIGALEAGAVASPTMSSTGTVSYQIHVGHPIESGSLPGFLQVFFQVFPQDHLVGSLSVHHVLRSHL